MIKNSYSIDVRIKGDMPFEDLAVIFTSVYGEGYEAKVDVVKS